MGTAANMNYASIVQQTDDRLTVVAIVTAGVEGNATAAGEPASWRETDAGIHKVPGYDGTINTMVDQSTLDACGTRARRGHHDRGEVSRFAAPRSAQQAPHRSRDRQHDARPILHCCPCVRRVGATSASPHLKLGELVGAATRQATMEALRWQNGLEPSYTRGVFHALGRHGVRESTIFEDIGSTPGGGRFGVVTKECQSGPLRAAGRRRGTRARGGLRSRPLWHDSGFERR